MKILWFANTPCGATGMLTGQPVIGGGWLYALSAELIKVSGIELHIAFYYHKQLEAFNYEGIWYHPIPHSSPCNKLEFIWSRFKERFISYDDNSDIKKVRKIVDKVKPDIIHIHGSEENFGLLSKYQTNKNIVISIQGLISPYNEKLFSGIPYFDIKRHEPVINRILFTGVQSIRKRFSLRAIREREILKNIKHVIGRTQWDYNCSLALNPARNYYIVNEILRPEFLSHTWKPFTLESNFVISTTVSNGLYKGLESIYKTAKLLKDGQIKFTWNVIGVSNLDYITKVVESYLGYSSSEINLQLLGRKSANEMLSVLDKSHLFVQISHIENSPNSLCEAMSIGMPIIATFAGGTSSMLKDGEEGILVQDGDSYTLAGAIISAMDQYPNMLKMARNAQLRALSRHNPNNVVNELLNVYNIIYDKTE